MENKIPNTLRYCLLEFNKGILYKNFVIGNWSLVRITYNVSQISVQFHWFVFFIPQFNTLSLNWTEETHPSLLMAGRKIDPSKSMHPLFGLSIGSFFLVRSSRLKGRTFVANGSHLSHAWWSVWGMRHEYYSWWQKNSNILFYRDTFDIYVTIMYGIL